VHLPCNYRVYSIVERPRALHAINYPLQHLAEERPPPKTLLQRPSEYLVLPFFVCFEMLLMPSFSLEMHVVILYFLCLNCKLALSCNGSCSRKEVRISHIRKECLQVRCDFFYLTSSNAF
jgi:hypothetical protein